jgi:pyruvate/2-oxoglutarate dehydrogenase complex dihydrolipoamide acyltransferase (E2) component
VSETPVVLPKWGLTMLDVTLVEWLKQEGERVDVDEPICLVETDKVDAEVTAPVAGVLGRLLVHKDDVVQVGATLTTIREG